MSLQPRLRTKSYRSFSRSGISALAPARDAYIVSWTSSVGQRWDAAIKPAGTSIPEGTVVLAVRLNEHGQRQVHEIWEGVFHHLTAACAIPCFTDSSHTGFTPAGEVLDQEYDRAGEFLDVLEREARKRTPENGTDRDERLNVLVRHEMTCNGRRADAYLLAELNAAIEA